MPPRIGWTSVLVTLALAASCTCDAPKSIFPSSSSPTSSSHKIDITTSNRDPYVAEASQFFPSSSPKNKGLKFPGSSAPSTNERMSSAPQESDLVIPLMDSSSSSAADVSDEAAANEAIDIILRSARSGKSMDLSSATNGGNGNGADLAKVASDPVIQQQLASGNEVEARGYIRNKLCGLGLMPCGPPHGHHGGHHGLRPVGHHGGHGGGWGPGIPAKDVTLVQPVALKPVGYPIAAVPLEKGHHHGGHHGGGGGYLPGPPPPPFNGGGGYGGGGHHASYAKQYGPPIAKPVYHPPGPGPIPLRPSPQYVPKPTYGGGLGGGIGGGKPLVEHVHHHIHHTPSSSGGIGIGNSGKL